MWTSARPPAPTRSGPSPLRLAVLLLALGAGGAAQAQLFADNDARKAIIDLRARLDQNAENLRASQTASERLRTELTDLVKQLQRSVLELNTQNEQLRTELAAQRGNNEQILRDLGELQRRLADQSQTLDQRLRKLEPQRVGLDGREFLAQTSETRDYNDALTLLRQGDFVAAASALKAFQSRYPESGYLNSVRYWLGNALYGKREYAGAIESFRALVLTQPDHPRAPEALLAVANCQIELKDNKAARATLDELVRTFPKSEAATAARERLSTLK